MQTIYGNIGGRIRRNSVSIALGVGQLLLILSTPTRADEMFADVSDVVAEPVPVADFVADPQQQQFRAQFEPMLKVELSFANRVCKLTDEERRTLISKSNTWLDEYARDFAKRGGQFQNGQVWFRNGVRGGRANQDPRESIQAGVKKLVEAHLPKEKSALYEDEFRKRSEFQQKAAVQNLVAQMDLELLLSPKQRERLTESLSSNWHKNWAPQAEMFIHTTNAWPNVPDQHVRPILTPAQQAVWDRLNKVSGQMFFGNAFGMEGQVIDDIDLKEREESKPDAAAR